MSRDRQDGFTLVELVTTMIVLGILAVAIVPRMDTLSGWNAIGFRDQVKATLEFARKAAVAQRRSVQVSFTTNSVSIAATNDIPENSPTTYPRTLVLPGRDTGTIAAPSGVSVSSTVSPLVFDPLGRSAGATITVGGAGTITVVAETGYVY